MANGEKKTTEDKIEELYKELFELKKAFNSGGVAPGSRTEGELLAKEDGEWAVTKRETLTAAMEKIKEIEDKITNVKYGVDQDELAALESGLIALATQGFIEQCAIDDFFARLENGDCATVWGASTYEGQEGYQKMLNRVSCALAEWLIKDEDKKALHDAINNLKWPKVEALVNNRKKNCNEVSWLLNSNKRIQDVSANAVANMYAYAFKKDPLVYLRKLKLIQAGAIPQVGKDGTKEQKAKANPFLVSDTTDSRKKSLDVEWCGIWASYVMHDKSFISGNPSKMVKMGIENRRKKKGNFYSYSPLEVPLEVGDFLICTGGHNKSGKVYGAPFEKFLAKSYATTPNKSAGGTIPASLTMPINPTVFFEATWKSISSDPIAPIQEFTGTRRFAILSGQADPDSGADLRKRNGDGSVCNDCIKGTGEFYNGSSFKPVSQLTEKPISSSKYYKFFREAYNYQAWLFYYLFHKDNVATPSHIWYCLADDLNYFYLISPNSTGGRCSFRKMRKFHAYVKTTLSDFDKGAKVKGTAPPAPLVDGYIVPFKTNRKKVYIPAFKGSTIMKNNSAQVHIPMGIVKPAYRANSYWSGRLKSMLPPWAWGEQLDSSKFGDADTPSGQHHLPFMNTPPAPGTMPKDWDLFEDPTKATYTTPANHFNIEVYAREVQEGSQAARYGYYSFKPCALLESEWESLF